MKKWSVLLIVCVSLFASVACASQAAAPVKPTEKPAANETANAEVVASTAASEAATLSPSPTSLPTEIPTVAPTPTPDLPPRWIWGWTQDPAQIVAISTDGQTNVLLDTPDPDSFISSIGFWQVGPDKALAMYMDGSAPTAYLLTTTGATELTLPSVQITAPDNAWRLAAVSGSNVVIRYPYSWAEAAILINTDSAEATLLAPNVADLTPAARFSADGRYLRFVTTDPSEGNPSQVVERDLTTGQDRTLYAYENYDHVYSDATGDIWLDFRSGEVTVADGRPSNPQPPRSVNISRYLVGDWIMISEYACEQDCPLTLSPIFGSEPTRTYILPEKSLNQGIQSWLLDDQSLLVYDSGKSSYWRLTADGQGQLVGRTDPNSGFRTIISTGAGDSVTNDSIIDTQTGTVIPLPIPFDDPANFWIDRYSNGLILSYYQSDTDQAAWVLLDGSQTFIDLPADADTYCYEILADSNVICQSYETGGVLRYEPASGTLTQLSDLPIYMTASGN